MSQWGRYRVTGRHDYRGNKPGQEFIARLDRQAEGRAVLRGDIALLERVSPELPARWGLPDGWSTEGKER